MNKKGEKQQASQSDVGSRQQSKQPKVDEKLQAPQPVRSHPDMVALVTEQLRRDPFPVIRQPSPKVTGFGNTPMGAAGVDSQSGIASVLDSSGSVGGRKIISPSLPAPLGVYQLAELAGNAYLGDRISFHGSHMTGGRSGDFTRPHSRSTSPSAAARPASGLDSAPFNAFNLQRAYSLEGMQEYISSVPCMIRMPVSKEYHQLGDSLENIPKNSWLVPYMIAACPPSILRHLMMLPVLFSHLNSHASGGDKIAATQPFVSPMEVPAARFPYHAAVHSKADNIPESSLTVDRIKSHNDISGAHFFYGFGRPHHMIRIPLNEKQSLLYSKDKLEQLQQQQLQQQQRTIYEHQGVIDATAAPHTVEAATVEAPRDAVDPSASVFYPSADGKPRSSVVRRTNSPGLLVSALNFPKSWHSLGVVWLSKDPSWSPWEAKIVLLLDNYLLECTVDGLSIIGYAQLCKANVVKTTYPSTAATRFRQAYQRMNAHDVEASSNDSRLSNVVVLDAIATNDANSKVSSGGSRMRSSSGGQPLPPLPSINESQTFTSAGYSMDSLQDMHDADAPTMDFPSGLNSPQSARDLTPNRSRRSPYQTHGGELCSSALLITCYTTSDLQNCPTKTFWLTVTSEELLDGIASALSKASKLTVDDVFHFPGRRQFTRSDSNRSSREEVDADSGLLGRGQYNEVRVAVRRDQRDIFDDDKYNNMFRGRAANAAHGSSGQKNHLNDSEADADYASDDSDQNPAVASFRSVASVEIGNSLHSSIHNSLHSPVNEPGTQHSSPRSRRPDFDNSTHTTDSSEDAAALTIEGEDAAVERGGIAVRRGSATSIDPIPLLKGDPSSHSSCGAPPPSEDATLLPTASTSGHGDNTTHGLFASVRAAPVPLKDSRADEEYDLPVNVHAAPTPAAAAAVATQSIASDGAATIGNADLKSPADGQKCALKLVAKEIFWSRAAEGKERTDSLVREALAQLLLCCHFAGNYVLTFVNEDVFTYADTEATSTVVNDKDTSCGGSRHVAQAQRLQQTRSDPYLPIVQLFSVFETVNGLALELELMQSKDLFDRLAEEGPFSEQQVKQIVYQLIEAVSLCNRLGIAHRDIKLSNITFPFPPTDAEALPPTLEEQDFITVKLADFGMTGFVGADRQLRGRCGTPGYVAPDILLAERNQSYDLNVDIFSVGVVAYTLLCGYEPFYGEDSAELLRANKLVDYSFHSPEWDEFSEEAKDFISRALQPHSSQRFHPEETKKHAWLQGALNHRKNRLSARAEKALSSPKGSSTPAGRGKAVAEHCAATATEGMMWSPETCTSRRCTIS